MFHANRRTRVDLSELQKQAAGSFKGNERSSVLPCWRNEPRLLDGFRRFEYDDKIYATSGIVTSRNTSGNTYSRRFGSPQTDDQR